MRESKWFKEGIKAYDNGMMTSDCPYLARSAKALIWLEGYNQAALIDSEQSGVHCTAHVDYAVDSTKVSA